MQTIREDLQSLKHRFVWLKIYTNWFGETYLVSLLELHRRNIVVFVRLFVIVCHYHFHFFSHPCLWKEGHNFWMLADTDLKQNLSIPYETAIHYSCNMWLNVEYFQSFPTTYYFTNNSVCFSNLLWTCPKAFCSHLRVFHQDWTTIPTIWVPFAPNLYKSICLSINNHLVFIISP